MPDFKREYMALPVEITGVQFKLGGISAKAQEVWDLVLTEETVHDKHLVAKSRILKLLDEIMKSSMSASIELQYLEKKDAKDN